MVGQAAQPFAHSAKLACAESIHKLSPATAIVDQPDGAEDSQVFGERSSRAPDLPEQGRGRLRPA